MIDNNNHSKKVLSIKQSDSLINTAFSCGWTKKEEHILKIALQKYGISKWTIIRKHGILNHKTNLQLQQKTQRLLGQQSLAEYAGLHLDIDKVNRDNMAKVGVKRKNNCIINVGDNQNRQYLLKKRQENLKKYGLTKQQISSLEVPQSDDADDFDQILNNIEESKEFSTIEKIILTNNIKEQIEAKIRTIVGDNLHLLEPNIKKKSKKTTLKLEEIEQDKINNNDFKENEQSDTDDDEMYKKRKNMEQNQQEVSSDNSTTVVNYINPYKKKLTQGNNNYLNLSGVQNNEDDQTLWGDDSKMTSDTM